jgi:hypothetical protein
VAGIDAAQHRNRVDLDQARGAVRDHFTPDPGCDKRSDDQIEARC